MTGLVYSASIGGSPYVYEDGVPVRYDHTQTTYRCRNGCVQPELHAAVEAAMMEHMDNLPSTSRVRLAKVAMMHGEEVDIKRLANE